MIDVTFLLLAFFVVVSNMDPQKAMALPKASYGESVPDKSCVTLLVTPDETGDGYVVYKGKSMNDEDRLSSTEPEDQEAEIGDFVDNDLSQFPGKTAIMIKAEGDVKTGVVEMVKRGVSRAELAETRQIFVGVEEER